MFRWKIRVEIHPVKKTGDILKVYNRKIWSSLGDVSKILLIKQILS